MLKKKKKAELKVSLFLGAFISEVSLLLHQPISVFLLVCRGDFFFSLLLILYILHHQAHWFQGSE